MQPALGSPGGAGATGVAAALTFVLVVCAGLEAAVGFCLGCRVYDVVGPAWDRLWDRRASR